MPIYEYRCLDCGVEFEELTRSSAGDTAVTCRGCSGSRVTRVLSTFATPSAGDLALVECGPCGACGPPGVGCVVTSNLRSRCRAS